MNRLTTLIALLLFMPSLAWTAFAAEVSPQDILTGRDTTMVETHRPRVKMSGFRIQIYSGSNGRKSKIEAQDAGEICKVFFPELSVYCRYKEPRWYTRVGDFTTMESAKKYLDLMRKTTQFKECHIVKSQITRPIDSITTDEHND